MQLDTVILRHKKKNREIKVNALDYASDLGQDLYRAYELVRENYYGDAKETIRTDEGSFTVTQKEAQEANKAPSQRQRAASDEKVKVIQDRKTRNKRSLPSVEDGKED